MKFFKNNIKIILIFMFIFLIRIIYLESDLPYVNVTEIFSVDEGYYTIPAFNLYHYGEMSHQILNYIPDDGSPVNVFQNILTYFSLEIFGNTYYGLRFASVFVSMIVLILFYLLAKNLLKHREFKYKNHLLIGTTIYLGIDFEFLLLSRVAEPTIFRTFSMMFLIYLFYLREKYNKIDSKIWTFFIGLFATFSVFFVYFYNLFILAGSWFAIILYFLVKKEQKKAIIHTIIYGFGFILGVLLFELFLRTVYNQNLIDYFQSMQMYSSRLSYSKGFIGFIKNIFINLFNMFGTNIFRFNISFLFIFLLFIPIFIYKLKKDKKYFDFIVFSLVFMHILQILFENSYFYRRLTILLPLILLIIILSSDYFTIFIENFKKNIYLRVYFIFIILFSLIIFYIFNISSYGLGSLNNESFINIGLGFIIINILTYFTLKKLLYNFVKGKIFYIAVVYTVLLSNIYLNYTNIYSNPIYNLKNTMQKLNFYNICNLSLGILSFEYRLYNSIKPLLNFYKYTKNTKYYEDSFNKIFENNCVHIIEFDNIKATNYLKISDIISKTSLYTTIYEQFFVENKLLMNFYTKIKKQNLDTNSIYLMKMFNCKKSIFNLLYIQFTELNKKTLSQKENMMFYEKYLRIFDYDKEMKEELNKCIHSYNDLNVHCIIESKTKEDIEKCNKLGKL